MDDSSIIIFLASSIQSKNSSISVDILSDKRHHDDLENVVPNVLNQQESSNSLKRPKPAPRLINFSKEFDATNLEQIASTNLKSYNPNRKLKRNRNS